MLCAVAFALVAATTQTQAAAVNIVALGASNTAAKGLSSQQAYPAQLEAMLRARDYDAHVSNAGVNGDTTAGMLGRLGSSVPPGTHVVILQPGGNDMRATRRNRIIASPEQRQANIAAIMAQLRARHQSDPAEERLVGSRPIYSIRRPASDPGRLPHHRQPRAAAGGGGDRREKTQVERGSDFHPSGRRAGAFTTFTSTPMAPRIFSRHRA